MIHRFLIGAACLALGGCAALPAAGPTKGAILDNETFEVDGDSVEPYALFSMNLDIANRLGGAFAQPIEETRFFPDEAPQPFALDAGDTVEITIVSVDETGFLDFTQAALSPISTSELPPQRIGEDGRIQVPPLGRIQAEGLTPEELERRLTAALGDVLIDPSVVVQVTDRQTDRASIIGRVSQPGSYPLLRENLRLVDVLATAGGPVGQVEDLVVRIDRGGAARSIPLTQLLSDPSTNIQVRPGDVVTIQGARRRFSAIGALVAPGLHDFERPQLSLADALAISRGQETESAARNGVFVYRFVPTRMLDAFGAPPNAFAGNLAPAVFHFDFRSPTMMFAAQQFEMQDGDVLYVADSEVANVRKAMSVILPVAGSPARFVPIPAS